jgi:solute carrier family 34 (sodium-dependent phosphate cotransporter)
MAKKPEDSTDERSLTAVGDGPNGDRARAKEAPLEAPAVHVEEGGGVRRIVIKVLYFIPALFLFILAIQLMKKGAEPLAVRLGASGVFDNGIQSLGMGWLGAYVVLSGSPVAVMALALRSADGLTELQTFTMITGSRLGASFIVLLVGFLYAIRSRNRNESVGMGVLALSISTLLYVPAMFIGYGILKSGILAGVDWTASSDVQGAIDVGWGWAVDLASVLPTPLLFPLGLGVILVAFKFRDFVLPTLNSEKHAGSTGRWLKRPWPMFFLGCLACLLTLSVSVAITVLVPLAARGHINRREALPYIMGANITTLADTLVAAMLLPDGVTSASSVQVVLALIIAVTAVTLLLLAVAYQPMARSIMALDNWVVRSRAHLWGFVGVLFFVPIALIVIGSFVGSVR